MQEKMIRKVYKVGNMEFPTHGKAVKYVEHFKKNEVLYNLRSAHNMYADCLSDYRNIVGMLEETKLTDGEIRERWEMCIDAQGWYVHSKSAGYSVLLSKKIDMNTRHGLCALRAVVRYRLHEDLMKVSDDLRRYKMRIKEEDRNVAKCLSICGKNDLCGLVK